MRRVDVGTEVSRQERRRSTAMQPPLRTNVDTTMTRTDELTTSSVAAVCEFLVRCGVTDNHNDGLRQQTIAEHMDCHPGTAGEYLRDAVDRGWLASHPAVTLTSGQSHAKAYYPAEDDRLFTDGGRSTDETEEIPTEWFDGHLQCQYDDCGHIEGFFHPLAGLIKIQTHLEKEHGISENEFFESLEEQPVDADTDHTEGDQ